MRDRVAELPGAGQTHGVPTTKLTSTDAFLVVDLEGAPRAVGTVRMAKKILVDGAALLARSRTYQHALFGQQVSGASAGINAVGDARADAQQAFVAEVPTIVADTRIVLEAGKGTDPEVLAPLLEAAPAVFASRAELRGIGAAAAAGAALGGLDGRTIAVEVADATGVSFCRAAIAAGAKLVAAGTPVGVLSVADSTSGLDPDAVAAADADPEALRSLGTIAEGALLQTDADVVAPSSKVGLVDHEIASGIRARLLVPLGWAPVTARGLAVARRAGVEVLADFLTLGGEAFAFTAGPDATVDEVATEARAAIGAVTAEAMSHEEGAYLGACVKAEDFLATWQDALPFGRPLA